MPETDAETTASKMPLDDIAVLSLIRDRAVATTPMIEMAMCGTSTQSTSNYAEWLAGVRQRARASLDRLWDGGHIHPSGNSKDSGKDGPWRFCDPPPANSPFLPREDAPPSPPADHLDVPDRPTVPRPILVEHAEPAVYQDVMDWLTERFREKRQWERSELMRVGILEAGFTQKEIIAAIRELPIHHFWADDHRFEWRARDGWPAPPCDHHARVGAARRWLVERFCDYRLWDQKLLIGLARRDCHGPSLFAAIRSLPIGTMRHPSGHGWAWHATPGWPAGDGCREDAREGAREPAGATHGTPGDSPAAAIDDSFLDDDDRLEQVMARDDDDGGEREGDGPTCDMDAILDHARAMAEVDQLKSLLFCVRSLCRQDASTDEIFRAIEDFDEL